MGIGNALKAIGKLPGWRKKRQSLDSGSNNSSKEDGQTSHSSRSQSPGGKHRNLPKSCLKAPRQRLSAGTKRTRIARHLDRLQAEAQELDSEWSKLYGDFGRAAKEHDHLLQRLDELLEVKVRQAENQAAQETFLDRLIRMCTGKQEGQRRLSIPKVQKEARKYQLQKRIKRIGLRKDHIQANVNTVGKLLQWIAGEAKIQKNHHKTAEGNEDGDLDFDDFLIETLDERKLRRQMLRKKYQDGDCHITTQERGYDLSKEEKKNPIWMPSSDVFSAHNHDYVKFFKEHSLTMEECLEPPEFVDHKLHHEDYAQQGITIPKPLKNNDVPGRRTKTTAASLAPHPDDTIDPIAPSFRRLSLKPTRPQGPIQTPLPCRHNSWMPRPIPEPECHNCRKDKIYYYCPFCPAEVCIACFKAAQPNGGQVAISSRIFPKGSVLGQAK